MSIAQELPHDTTEMVRDSLLYKILHSKKTTIVFKILSSSFCTPEMVRDSLLYKILHSKKTTIVFKILSSSFSTPEMVRDSLLYKILHSKKTTIVFKILSSSFCTPEMVRDSLLYKILHSKKKNNCLQNLIHKFLHAGNGAGFPSLQDPEQQKTIVFKILSTSFSTSEMVRDSLLYKILNSKKQLFSKSYLQVSARREMVRDSLLYKILHSKKQLFSKSYPQVSARRKWGGIPFFTRSCTLKKQTIVFKILSTSFCTPEMGRDSLLYKILNSRKKTIVFKISSTSFCTPEMVQDSLLY